MTIVFNCEFCGKKVSAPDTAGGRRGKCPGCNQYVFIPREQVEDIPLSPIDPEEEKRREALKQEEAKLLRQLYEHKEAPEKNSAPPPQPVSEDDDTLPFLTNAAPLADLVQQYLVHMAKGELEAATAVQASIVAGGNKALKKVEEMAMQDYLHPQLAGVPPTVISGFFKRLLSQFPK